MSKKDTLRKYLSGWRKGAAFLHIDPAESSDPAFTKGWADGRAACRAAQAEAESALGVKLDMFRPAPAAGPGEPPADAQPGEGEGE